MRWEYTIYSHKQPSGMIFRGAGDIPTDEIESGLNKLGAEGWEAVGLTLKRGDLMTWPVVLLKRPIE